MLLVDWLIDWTVINSFAKQYFVCWAFCGTRKVGTSWGGGCNVGLKEGFGGSIRLVYVLFV